MDYKNTCLTILLMVVLNSGVIAGAFMNSGSVRCGTSICRPISGIFAKNPLPNGYIHVATIPAGASNITITELRNSINFLALKSTDSKYILNGDYAVSENGPYEAAGSIFDYFRVDSGNTSKIQKRSDGVTEWITSSGPTYEPVHLMVLSQQTNPGVKYEYLLPITLASTSEEDGKDGGLDYFSSSEQDNSPPNTRVKAADPPSTTNKTTTSRKKRKFQWKVIGFTPCTKTCGGGTQTPIMKCVREQPTRAFSAKRCAHLKQPILNESLMKCNAQPCPAFWKVSEWSDCKCGSFDELENQSRETKCVQELISGVVIQVNGGACVEERPATILKCECLGSSKTSKLEVYKHVKPSNHHQNDINGHRSHKNKTVKVNKKVGTWLTSDWSEQCSSECGVGLQFRTIFCERTAPTPERCDLRLTPDTNRECTSSSKCAFGDWFIGPWSLCTGDCFNSTKSRTVVCIKDNSFAEESDCDLEGKPATFEDCDTTELKDCKPRWHHSDWTECNKPCAGGTQRRTVKCLEPAIKENMLRESNACKYSERPIGYRACNSHDCSISSTTEYDPRVDLIQNDASCRDEFPNCNLVIKAKLCGYAYYNEHCCQSCRLISNEVY